MRTERRTETAHTGERKNGIDPKHTREQSTDSPSLSPYCHEQIDAPVELATKQLAEQVTYDAEVAEQQWGALQRAQEVTVAKVQPLRANLPTRGQRHSFSQVLQTEVGREMTIRFAAANTKHVGWFKQALYFGGGFLLLWIFVSMVANREPRRERLA